MNKFWIGLALTISIFFLSFVLLFMQSANPHDKTARSIDISPGQSAKAVATKLHEAGIIGGETPWLLALKLVGGENSIQAGKYTFLPSQSNLEIILTLTQGDVARPDLVKVTFPEGESIYKMGIRLDQARVEKGGSFQELVESRIPERLRVKFPFLKEVKTLSLEGYLFPDTYKFDLRIPADDLADLMLARFADLILPLWDKEKSQTPLSLHEVVTLASIVEKEAAFPEERPIIASVFLNRLGIHMKLDADPTVKYALEAPHKIVRYNDLKVDSPYNTYMHAGLPPGPIGNPGLQSIQAVLHPAETNFLYFVADPSGHHIFSKTLEEHNRVRKKLSSKEYSP